MAEIATELTQQIREQFDPQFELVKGEFIPWAPWHVPGPKAKVALISTGGVYFKKGLHHPYESVEGGDPSFREFPSIAAAEDLELAAAHYDQSAARSDINVLFPLERLQELATMGYIGSVAPFAYSFAGHITRPVGLLANFSLSLAYRLKRMGAEVALIIATGPVEHQTAAIVARAAELAGVPTVVLGTNRAILEAVGTPRAVVVKNPAGAPLGTPGNSGKHQHILREALEAAWQFEGPGLIAEL